MERVPVRLRPPYDVLVGSGLLAGLGAGLARLAPGDLAFVVTDSNVARHWLEPALASLAAAGYGTAVEILPPGEGTKTPAIAARLWEALVAAGADRRTPVVALGGGVVSDLAGFAAATALRGLPWVAAPTSLLAQVDAAVGGKTGVNLPAGKNLVGAFWQPRGVFADVDTLATLPERHRRAGLAEVVKIGLGLDADLLGALERDAPALLDGDPRATARAVAAAVRKKAEVVAADERDGGPRRLLNLGHTAGHAIEAEALAVAEVAAGSAGDPAAGAEEAVLHGEAVAAGLLVACRMARARGLAGEEIEARARALLAALGLPLALSDLALPVAPAAVAARLGADKKRAGRRLALVLPVAAGRSVVVEDGTAEEVLAALH